MPSTPRMASMPDDADLPRLGAVLAAAQAQLARLRVRMAESDRRMAASRRTLARCAGLIEMARRKVAAVGLDPSTSPHLQNGVRSSR